MASQLRQNLENYPTIKSFASPEWIGKYETLEPWEIDNQVARWLTGSSRYGATFAAVLESQVEICVKLGAGGSRIGKLFSIEDTSSIWPALSELFVANWLKSFAHSVSFRSDIGGGPDLAVCFVEAQEHRIEIKAFQGSSFWNELTDRCMALGMPLNLRPQFQVCETGGVAFGDAGSVIPTDFHQQQQLVAQIVESQIGRIRQPMAVVGKWERDLESGICIRWRKGEGLLTPRPSVRGAIPEQALMNLTHQLTSGGAVRGQIKQADSVFVCVSRHVDLPEFYILPDILDASSSAEIDRMFGQIPLPVYSLKSLGNLVVVAASIDQTTPHRAYSIELPHREGLVRSKQKSLRDALDSQCFVTYSTRVAEEKIAGGDQM